MTARQLPLLAVHRALTPSQRETLRRYGSLEVAGVRRIRLAREMKAHQKRMIQAGGGPRPSAASVAKSMTEVAPWSVPHLSMSRAFATPDATKRNGQTSI